MDQQAKSYDFLYGRKTALDFKGQIKREKPAQRMNNILIFAVRERYMWLGGWCFTVVFAMDGGLILAIERLLH